MEEQIKHEFDNIKEYENAMKHLELYHDCIKCHGKIVAIRGDLLGNTYCGYCGEKVLYPRLKKEVFEEMLKQEINKRQVS